MFDLVHSHILFAHHGMWLEHRYLDNNRQLKSSTRSKTDIEKGGLVLTTKSAPKKLALDLSIIDQIERADQRPPFPEPWNNCRSIFGGNTNKVISANRRDRIGRFSFERPFVSQVIDTSPKGEFVVDIKRQIQIM